MIIDGKIRKANGKLLTSLDEPRRLVEASRDYLVGQVAPQAGWLTPVATT